MVNYSNGKIYKIEPICEHEEGEIYIGSTTKTYLSQRMDKHRTDYKQWKDNKCRKISVFDLFDKYGVENCHILLIENVNVDSKDGILSREGYYIQTLKCINKVIPKRTKKEWLEENKEKIIEKQKQWNEEHKDELKLYRRSYYIENKDKIDEYKEKWLTENKQHVKNVVKDWYKNNIDVQREKHRNYYHMNKEKIKEQRKKYIEDNKERIKAQKQKWLDENKQLRKQKYDENKDIINERKSKKHVCVCGVEYSQCHKARHEKSLRHQNYLQSLN
jgi:hypothetical protein